MTVRPRVQTTESGKRLDHVTPREDARLTEGREKPRIMVRGNGIDSLKSDQLRRSLATCEEKAHGDLSDTDGPRRTPSATFSAFKLCVGVEIKIRHLPPLPRLAKNEPNH
ncbi:unnamed protein product, partial [Lota lota]